MSIEHWKQNRHLKCELQIRTIHEEAWGEFSHEFTYPHDTTDPLAGELIKRLSGLLHLAEDMVSDIRRAPADGRLFQRAHALSNQSEQPAFDSVHELIASSHFMNRSAPLAAIALMTTYTGKSSDIVPGETIQADRIVSLGFDKLDQSGDGDELARLYLEAHKQWKGSDSTRRVVSKFFVWRKSKDEEFKPPTLFEEFSDDIELWIVPETVHVNIVCRIEAALGILKETFPSLKRFQFFLWEDTDSAAAKPAFLPRRKDLNPEEVTGFFAPYRDSDLAAGVLWLKDSGDPMRRILNAYSEIVLALRKQDGLLIRISRNQTASPLSDLSPEHEAALQTIVECHMTPLLASLGVERNE